MPFYEYECVKCNHQTEVLQKISDPPVTKCEKCHGKMRKIISQSTFHLKGSGWYVTDYASKSGGHDGKTGTGNSTSTDSGTGSAKEAKSSSSDTTSKKAEAKTAKAKD